jgi:glutathione synthase/RimK-type ligase-like ATP-grasp enzyme
MRKVALVTDTVNPRLNLSDTRLVPEFKKAGIEAVGVPWDEVGVEWEEYEAVILRSCWNYHEHYEDFSNWLDGLTALQILVWNPTSIILKNTHKTYLLELQKLGVPIIPTAIVQAGESVTAEDVMQTNGWDEVVIKPEVGAYGKNIARFTTAQLSEAEIFMHEILSKSDAVLQPFMPSICTSGEYSLVFINKEFSHAMQKQPKPGDFITSGAHRLREFMITADMDLISQAEAILQTIISPLLYARVDGVVEKGQFYLMELELTEPYLFLEREKQAAKKLVRAYLALTGR